MRFPVDIKQSELPRLLSRAIAITGPAVWTEREKGLARWIAENPLIDPYLDLHFGLERAMAVARQHRATTGRLPSMLRAFGPRFGALYGFAAITTLVFSRLPGKAQDALRRRIIGALKDNTGLAPLGFEM